MSIYHVVKRLGIPDSNIILMVADDLACNARNAFPAQLFNNESHHLDVYGQDVEVDYRGYEVTVSSFLQVLTGRHDPGVPRSKRLLSDASSNVLVHLSGHGGDEFMKFLDVQELLAQDLADSVEQMHEKGRYREMLIMVETCQAATLVQRISTPHVATVACSRKGEKSLSFKSDPQVGLSLIDRFTYQTLAFFEGMHLNSSATMADLLRAYRPDFLDARPVDRIGGLGRPADKVLLTDFFASVTPIGPELPAGPQDGSIHGDFVMVREYVGYLAKDSLEELDGLLKEGPAAARSGQRAQQLLSAAATAGVPRAAAGAWTWSPFVVLAVLAAMAVLGSTGHR